MDANKDLLYQHVEFLTTLRPFRNYQNLDSLEKVCDYLEREFSEYGMEPAEQKFVVQGSEYKDITASYNQEKRRRMIVGAHYDVCGDQQKRRFLLRTSIQDRAIHITRPYISKAPKPLLHPARSLLLTV